MTDLERLQRKMNEVGERTDWDVWKSLHNAEVMLQNDDDKKAVKAYLEMAVHFYGKERITATMQDYGFKQLKKYL